MNPLWQSLLTSDTFPSVLHQRCMSKHMSWHAQTRLPALLDFRDEMERIYTEVDGGTAVLIDVREVRMGGGGRGGESRRRAGKVHRLDGGLARAAGHRPGGGLKRRRAHRRGASARRLAPAGACTPPHPSALFSCAMPASPCASFHCPPTCRNPSTASHHASIHCLPASHPQVAEVARGTADKALNLPLSTLRGKLGELPDDKRLYVFCQVGPGSAAVTLPPQGRGTSEAHRGCRSARGRRSLALKGRRCRTHMCTPSLSLAAACRSLLCLPP
jgi:hypothetical protein